MKQLISVDNLDAFVGKDGTVHVGKDMILTPGAKDELRKRRIAIVYGESPAPSPATSCAAAVPAAKPAAVAEGTAGSGCRGCCGTCKKPEAPAAGAASSSVRDLESLTRAVAGLISTQYDITDPKQLHLLTVEALRTIKANI